MANFNKSMASLAIIGVLSACGGAAPTQSSGSNKQPAPVAAQETNACDQANCFTDNYIFYSNNVLVDENYHKVLALLQEGKELGYRGLMLFSGGRSAIVNLANNDQTILGRVAEIKREADKLGMELIPVGASPESLTYLDPGLTEALPVTDRLFSVKNGLASLRKSHNSIAEFNRAATDWNLLDGTSWDAGNGETSASSALGSVLFDSAKWNADRKAQRLYKEFTGLSKRTAYRLSFSIKTEDFKGPMQVQIYDGQTLLPLYMNASSRLGLGSQPNGEFNPTGNVLQENSQGKWLRYQLDFNSIAAEKVRIYLGVWNTKFAGKAWVDNIQLEEVGVNHAVEREGMAVSVKLQLPNNQSQAITRDEFVLVNEDIRFKNPAAFPDGSQLLVSWYQSSKGIANNTGYASPCRKGFLDKTTDILDNSLASNAFGENAFFLYYDEWRVMNWDPNCTSKTAAETLANTFKNVRSYLKEKHPNTKVFVWNDMFDPEHNAVANYWTVNGSLVPIKNTLDASTTVVNWLEYDNLNPDKQVRSLSYFSQQQVPQLIALYYDDVAKVSPWLASLKRAENSANPVRGVKGIVYTSWVGNTGYDNLKTVTNTIKQSGRWVQPDYPRK